MSDFHPHNNVLYVRLTYLYKAPGEYISQGQVAKQRKKLNIKALNPSDIGLSGAGGRCGGAWMSCAAALNVLPPGHRATCASAFAEAATAVGLQGVGTPDAAADGAPRATASAASADNAADEPPEQPVAPPAVAPRDTLAAFDDDPVAAPHGSIDALLFAIIPQNSP